MGWPDNFDYYELGQWGLGAGEFGGDGDLEYLGFNLDVPGLGDGTPDGQMWDRGFGGIDVPAEAFHAGLGRDLGEDALQHAWDWGVNPAELEIPQEGAVVLTGPPSSSTVPSSSSTINDTTASTSPETPSSNEGAASSSSNTPPTEEWLCDFANCGKSFSQRHRLK